MAIQETDLDEIKKIIETLKFIDIDQNQSFRDKGVLINGVLIGHEIKIITEHCKLSFELRINLNKIIEREK